MGRHKGSTAWNKGLAWSEASKQKMSLSHIGQSPPNKGMKGLQVSWNKGLTKDTDSRLAKSAETNSMAQLGKTLSETTKRKIAEALVRCWRNEEYVRKQFQAASRSPNHAEIKLESILNRLAPTEWKFVGDFSLWINGMNPDFVNINGQKKIIELFGDYWHRGETGKDRIDNFAQYGFKTLVIWEKELLNIESLSDKILIFAKEGG